MENRETLSSFGNYLQSIRLEKHISIDLVAAETRIRQEMIRRIEAEDHDHLPDPVFVRGYIKAVAEAIGADAEEALNRYQQRHQRVTPIMRSGPRSVMRSTAPDRFWLRLGLALGGTVALIAISLYGYQWMEKRDSLMKPAANQALPEIPAPEPATEAVPAPAAPEAAAPVDAVEAVADVPAPPATHTLSVEARDDTWLKIIVDDQPPVRHSLKPGDAIELTAQRGFNLLVGNATGISLRLDGRAIPVPGKKGQVVNLDLP
jgi:cytoskeletal protein RodZ